MRGLVREVIEIAKLAGREILEVYADESQFGVETKADNSPLTMADKKANDAIVKGLDKLQEHYPIISEENREIPFIERKDFNKFWLVDPLDGTKEFIKRNGEFTVNIALIERGQPILGVVHVPVIDVTYWGVKGQGAYLISEGVEAQLSANQYSIEDESLRIVCSRSHINDATQAFIDQLNRPVSVSKGSSLKFLLIASGEAEIYPRLGPTMEWDTGAAQIILEEAGGAVLESDSMEPLRYNKESLLNPHFIARGIQTV